MSGNISSKDRAQSLLNRLRLEKTDVPLDEVRAFGDEFPEIFFSVVVEALSDSFSVGGAKAYEYAMRAWIPPICKTNPIAPESTNRVYVLSRVTLGSDIKITSVILDAAKKRYPEAEIFLVGSRKTTDLFAGDGRVIPFEANYPRAGSTAVKLAFLEGLRLEGGIVIDPDSRFTQLGLRLPCAPENYFHFPSRTYRPESTAALGELASEWMFETFGMRGNQYLAVRPSGERFPGVAVSLGVGGNDSKRIGGAFEAGLLRLLAGKYRTIYIDRGAGGEERARVDAAVQQASVEARFCNGSFAEFAGVISQCEAYAGYDSAGQHAAAALGIPVTTIFAGAPNRRFEMRWRPEGTGPIQVIRAEGLTPEEILRAIH